MVVALGTPPPPEGVLAWKWFVFIGSEAGVFVSLDNKRLTSKYPYLKGLRDFSAKLLGCAAEFAMIWWVKHGCVPQLAEAGSSLRSE